MLSFLLQRYHVWSGVRLGLSTFHYATVRSTFYNKDIKVIRRVLVASDSINDPKGAARISKRDWLYKKEIILFQYAFFLEMCFKCTLQCTLQWKRAIKGSRLG